MVPEFNAGEGGAYQQHHDGRSYSREEHRDFQHVNTCEERQRLSAEAHTRCVRWSDETPNISREKRNGFAFPDLHMLRKRERHQLRTTTHRHQRADTSTGASSTTPRANNISGGELDRGCCDCRSGDDDDDETDDDNDSNNRQRIGGIAAADRISSRSPWAPDELQEASDVHWLNSIDGEACLLVDSYGDLGDGLAVQEAVCLIEGLPIGSNLSLGWNEACSVERVRAVLAKVEASRGRSALPPRILQPSFAQAICDGSRHACADLIAFLRRLQGLGRKMAVASDRRRNVSRTTTNKEHATGVKSGGVVDATTSCRGTTRVHHSEGSFVSPGTRRPVDDIIASERLLPRRAPTDNGISPGHPRLEKERKRTDIATRPASSKARRALPKVTGATVATAAPGKSIILSASTIDDEKSYGVLHRRYVGNKGASAKQTHTSSVSSTATALTTTATPAKRGAGERQSDRRDVLRWMERLGVKVDRSLLTPEGAKCHERLSSGMLLCELAAAVDYAASGGRGLPLSELPSCPGRFVLRGTCSEPCNSARARHNVRAALTAFRSMGGIAGFWTRSEESILEGSHEATWGLLLDVYACHGRRRPPCPPRRRSQSPTATIVGSTITAAVQEDVIAVGNKRGRGKAISNSSSSKIVNGGDGFGSQGGSVTNYNDAKAADASGAETRNMTNKSSRTAIQVTYEKARKVAFEKVRESYPTSAERRASTLRHEAAKNPPAGPPGRIDPTRVAPLEGASVLDMEAEVKSLTTKSRTPPLQKARRVKGMIPPAPLPAAATVAACTSFTVPPPPQRPTVTAAPAMIGQGKARQPQLHPTMRLQAPSRTSRAVSSTPSSSTNTSVSPGENVHAPSLSSPAAMTEHRAQAHLTPFTSQAPFKKDTTSSIPRAGNGTIISSRDANNPTLEVGAVPTASAGGADETTAAAKASGETVMWQRWRPNDGRGRDPAWGRPPKAGGGYAHMPSPADDTSGRDEADARKALDPSVEAFTSARISLGVDNRANSSEDVPPQPVKVNARTTSATGFDAKGGGGALQLDQPSINASATTTAEGGVLLGQHRGCVVSDRFTGEHHAPNAGCRSSREDAAVVTSVCSGRRASAMRSVSFNDFSYSTTLLAAAGSGPACGKGCRPIQLSLGGLPPPRHGLAGDSNLFPTACPKFVLPDPFARGEMSDLLPMACGRVLGNDEEVRGKMGLTAQFPPSPW